MTNPLLHQDTSATIGPLKSKMNQLHEDFIYFPALKGMKVLNAKSILYLKSESNYTYIFFSDGKKMLLSKTLKHLSSYLPERLFIRTHQSYIVNKSLVKKVQKCGMTLTDGTFIPVSRRSRKSVINPHYIDLDFRSSESLTIN